MTNKIYLAITLPAWCLGALLAFTGCGDKSGADGDVEMTPTEKRLHEADIRRCRAFEMTFKGDRNPVYNIYHGKYKGHDYIFFNPHGHGMTTVHDPDCKCNKTE
jgi:hypothetical protein